MPPAVCQSVVSSIGWVKVLPEGDLIAAGQQLALAHDLVHDGAAELGRHGEAAVAAGAFIAVGRRRGQPLQPAVHRAALLAGLHDRNAEMAERRKTALRIEAIGSRHGIAAGAAAAARDGQGPRGHRRHRA
jgi:hypothetical protein